MRHELVDWQKLLLTIRSKTSRDMARIARDVGANYQHIAKLSRGEVAEPSFGTGVRLLDYYYDLVEDMSLIKINH